jgi:hypothetical protein
MQPQQPTPSCRQISAYDSGPPWKPKRNYGDPSEMHAPHEKAQSDGQAFICHSIYIQIQRLAALS